MADCCTLEVFQVILSFKSCTDASTLTLKFLSFSPMIGLEALSKSVEDQLMLQDENAFIGTVHVHIPHHNFNFDLQMREGENLMTCATEGNGKEVLGEYLECACGGM